MNTELTQLMMKLKHVLHLMKQEELPPPPFNASTLCDLCSKACGFCEWSEYGNMRPVPGWEAIRNDISSGRVDGSTVVLESYIVLDCPKFCPDANGARYTFDREYAIGRFNTLRKGREDEE